MLETPYYLFDEEECIIRTREVKKNIATWGGKICYAIKANPFLVPILLDEVDKLEVCSPGELEICRKYCVPGEKILFSGVVKTKGDIKKALEYPVDVITLESLNHWELLKECIRDDENHMQSMIKIMPRLSSGAQFGMEEEQLLAVIKEQQNFPNMKLEGIHFFTGTQKKGNKYEKELEKADELIGKIKNEYSLNDLILEYGPGLAVPYFKGDDFDDIFGLIKAMKDYIVECKFSFRIDIELGRYLVATCGKYVTSIVDIKRAEGRNYCLVDGGIHHVNYYGSNMAMRTPIVHHFDKNMLERSQENMLEYMVCGSLCTFADVLIRGLEMENPTIGDVLVFDNIGAYSVTESSYLFLSRDLPGVYLKKKDGKIEILRDKMTSYEINSGGYSNYR